MNNSMANLKHTRQEVAQLIEEHSKNPQKIKEIFGEGLYLKKLFDNENYHYFSIAVNFCSEYPQAGTEALTHCFRDWIKQQPSQSFWHLEHLLADTISITESSDLLPLLRAITQDDVRVIFDQFVLEKTDNGDGYYFLKNFLTYSDENDDEHDDYATVALHDYEGSKLSQIALFVHQQDVLDAILTTIKTYGSFRLMDQLLDHSKFGGDLFAHLKTCLEDPTKKEGFNSKLTPCFLARVEKENMMREITKKEGFGDTPSRKM